MFKFESKSFLFSKENILISLFVSTLFCLFIISGENSLEGIRFTKSHDGVMIQKTAFDLINHFSGGNSSWSIYDLASRSFISFGGLSHTFVSIPIAFIYSILHKFLPSIPENILYRKVFIFSFFPLINLMMTFGYNIWLKVLKLNNFIVSVVLIPLLMALFGNEIWGLLYKSPSIALLPYLLIATTCILQKKIKTGISILIPSLVISFSQIPLLFTAYILPIPWMLFVISGILNYFKSKEVKSNFYLNKYLAFRTLIVSLFLSIIISIPKIASIPNFLNKTLIKYRIQEDSLNISFIEKLLDIISFPYEKGPSQLIDIFSIFFFGFAAFCISYLALLGFLREDLKIQKPPKIIKGFLKTIKSISFKNKTILVLTIISCLILSIEILYIVIDLKENYVTDTNRLNDIFNISEIPRRNFTKINPLKFVNYIFNFKVNRLLNGGGFGYIGLIPFILFLIGVKETFFKVKEDLRKNILISLLTLLLILFLLAIVHPAIRIIAFIITSLLYPFSFLQNNLSMLNYQLDYLLIPFISLGFTSLLIELDKFFKTNKSNLSLTGKTISILLISYIISFYELFKIKKFISYGNATYEKLKIDEGIINRKNKKFLIDLQNPILITSPVFNYKGKLPTVPKKGFNYKNLEEYSMDNNWKNFRSKNLKNFGTKFTHTGDYYKTVFLSRYESKPFIYETRHKSIEETELKKWPLNFISIKNDLKNQEIEKISKKYNYSDLPNIIDNCTQNYSYDCLYMNKISINITANDLIKNYKKINNNMVALKLPKFLDHISTNIFLDKKEVSLYIQNSQRKLFLDTSQGYLETDFSYDIGNIKKNHIVIKQSIIDFFQKNNKNNLILEINSPNGVSIIRKVNANKYTYYLNSNLNDRVLITSPYSKQLNIQQNMINIDFYKSNTPVKGLVKFNSKFNGISKLDISYKNHKNSDKSFVIINSLITLLTLLMIIGIITNYNLF